MALCKMEGRCFFFCSLISHQVVWVLASDTLSCPNSPCTCHGDYTPRRVAGWGGGGTCASFSFLQYTVIGAISPLLFNSCKRGHLWPASARGHIFINEQTKCDKAASKNQNSGTILLIKATFFIKDSGHSGSHVSESETALMSVRGPVC